MDEHKYLIVKFRGAGDDHAVNISIGVPVEDLHVSKIGKYYFLVFGKCKIGFPLEVLEKIVDLVNYILTQEE